MHKHHDHYVLYLESDANRVFGEALGQIAATELAAVFEALHPGVLHSLAVDRSSRATTLRFACELDRNRVAEIVGQLSSSLALLAEEGDQADGPNLRPITLTEHLRFGTELVTTQRYRGKTNERLTRSMLLVALAAAGQDVANPSRERRPVLVCDPMMGRGTTLNWALALGCNTLGIEPDRYHLDQHATFITQWAKRQRLPHTMQDYRPANAERRHSTLLVAPTRPELKAKEGQRLDTFCADGGDATLPIRKGSIDAIVTDLPYGIRHGNRQAAAGRPAKWDPRKTAQMLERVLPVWKKWLRPGGSVAIAWNTKRATGDEVQAILTETGFKPVDWPETGDGSPLGFAHWVDTNIDRDVIVARRG